MPLIEIDGLTANRNRKTNPHVGWPLRGYTDGDAAGDRLEGFAKPHFEPGFTLIPGEAIFTIGSCFARNIEQFLEEFGYEVPMRGLVARKELKLDSPSIANNYGVTSIAQELRWALDPPTGFEPEAFFEEIKPGRFIDMNVPGGVLPEPLDIVAARRAALMEATREVARCRVVLITLGLSEVWFDKKSGHYLNTAPLPLMLEREPERFALHVLSVAETSALLNEIMELLIAHGAPGVQVVLTVSPVPMNATFRPMDVMVANTHSKAVLRAAVEETVAGFDCAHYFPSYESVALSERSKAWRDDNIHVEPSLVALNVQRMLRAYAPKADAACAEDVLAGLEEMRTASLSSRVHYLEANEAVLLDDTRLTVRAAKTAIAGRALDMAHRLADAMPAETFPYWRETLNAEIALVEGEWATASTLAARIDELNEAERKADPVRRTLFRLKLDAALGAGDMTAALSAALSWVKADAERSGAPFFKIGAHMVRTGLHAEAVEVFESLETTLHANEIALIDYAEALWHVGRRDDAAAIVKGMETASPQALRRLRALSDILPAGTLAAD
ncbi:MAG: GSCFA domain-containing protein [Pseudomonadota bacterium]